jgi:alkanesulfonate monooxygenase SsuD/methylene tetrahydromethanopterin reductase-like flavin-dependent oxidoreductase (luciferase family)
VVGAANDGPSRATIGAAPLDDKVHHIRFEGASFSVVGPLITPRPPQGQVVVIAGDSLGVAGRADITLVGGFSARTGHGRQAIARRAEQARQAGSPLVFVELEVALDRPGEHADRRLARLNSSAPWRVTDRARFSGSAAALVEFLGGLTAHVDGVLFYLAETSVDLPVLAAEVLTALTAGGLAQEPAADAVTLRDVLGLPRPVNRFADPARAAVPGGATDSGRSTASA